MTAESPFEQLSIYVKMLESKVKENPYRALATAYGVGLGLAALKGSHLKSAVFYLGRLAAVSALSRIRQAVNVA